MNQSSSTELPADDDFVPVEEGAPELKGPPGAVRRIATATAPRADATGKAAAKTETPAQTDKPAGPPASPGPGKVRRATDKPGASPRLADVHARLGRLERHNRLLRYALVLVVGLSGYAVFDEVFPEGVIVHKTLMESKELKLVDGQGNPRLFLRMYSRVPVMQIVDSNGKPRLSLGLRFDDTPFIDLSDKRGNTRATLEMTEQDAPALRLFDEHGHITFKIN